MDQATHKVLDVLQHTWPYVSGVIITMMAGLKLWWSTHRNTQKRITTLENDVKQTVTHEELHACRDDVRDTDVENENKILTEIKHIREDMREDNRINSKAHQDIITTSTASHRELMTQIIKLHDHHK